MSLPLKRKPPRLLALVIVSLYATSFLLPAIHDGGQQLNFPRLVSNPAGGVPHGYWDPVVPGWVVFCDVVAMLPFSAWFVPSWLANLALVIGLFLLVIGRPTAARVLAAVGLGLALASVPVILFITGHWMTPLVGYYVWLAAMALFAVVAWATGGGMRRRPWRENDLPDRIPAAGVPEARIREGREERVIH